MADNTILIRGPLSLGDIIDRAFRLYRAYFGPLALTAAAVLVPFGAIDAVLSAVTPPAPISAVGSDLESTIFSFMELYLAGMGGSTLWYMQLLRYLLSLVVSLALTYQTVVLLYNREPGLAESLVGGLHRFWAYFWNMILTVLAYGLAGLLLALPGLCLGPFVVLLVIPGILLLAARWIATLPVIVAEEAGPIEAFQRSWRLTQDMVWRSIGFSFLIGILSIIAVGMPALVIGGVLALILPSSATGTISALTNVGGSIVTILWSPLTIIFTLLYYYDLRVRQEGYDLSLRVDQLVSDTSTQVHADTSARPAVLPPAEELDRFARSGGETD
jgi:hypothetical protein